MHAALLWRTVDDVRPEIFGGRSSTQQDRRHSLRNRERNGRRCGACGDPPAGRASSGVCVVRERAPGPAGAMVPAWPVSLALLQGSVASAAGQGEMRRPGVRWQSPAPAGWESRTGAASASQAGGSSPAPYGSAAIAMAASRLRERCGRRGARGGGLPEARCRARRTRPCAQAMPREFPVAGLPFLNLRHGILRGRRKRCRWRVAP